MLFSKKAREQFMERTMAEAANSIGKTMATFRSVADNTPLYEKLKANLARAFWAICFAPTKN